MDTYISLIPIFADTSYHQTHEKYYKILTNKDNSILKIKVNELYDNIETCLKELYSSYLKIDYDWTTKELSQVRKNKNEIEITYVCRTPYIPDAIKGGKLITVTDFMNSIMDVYYVEIISGRSPQFFR